MQHKLSVAGGPQPRIATLVLSVVKVTGDQLLVDNKDERVVGAEKLLMSRALIVSISVILSTSDSSKFSFFSNMSEVTNSLTAVTFFVIRRPFVSTVSSLFSANSAGDVAGRGGLHFF